MCSAFQVTDTYLDLNPDIVFLLFLICVHLVRQAKLG